MQDDMKATQGNRPSGQKKRTSKSKCKLPSKRNNSSLSKRRKKKSLAKLVSQNSVDNVHCFPIPFADFFCGCGKDCGKEKNKIKKISSKKLSKIGKKDRPPSKSSEKESADRSSKKGFVREAEVQSQEGCPTLSSEAFAGLTEPLDFDKLKLNGNMKHLLANVKFTSIFGCANVPKSMSQIKILLDNNPALRSQLKHILGDNLKNENMKPVAELLASDKESSSDGSSNDSIRCLSISRLVLDTRKDITVESVDSSFILSNKNENATKSLKSSRVGHGSNARSRNPHEKCGSRHSDPSESQTSLFSKIFSSVFRPTKPGKCKRQKPSSRETLKTSKKGSQGEISMDEEKMKEMRDKYDEWYQRTPEEVRERFRWEDYVRVTMYLNDIKGAGSNDDRKTKEMLNLWLRKFSKEMNRPKSSGAEDQAGQSERVSEPKEPVRAKIKRIISEEMLNSGGGDVIGRLNSLMKELVDGTENADDVYRRDDAGDGEEEPNRDPEQPGCSKWFEPSASKTTEDAGKSSTTTDEVSIYQMMCASFVDKLSKHGSKENKSVLGSRYASEMPWQNKDFQVFYLPTVQTRYSFDCLRSGRDYGYYGDRVESTESVPENRDGTDVTRRPKAKSEESRASLTTGESSGTETAKGSYRSDQREDDTSEEKRDTRSQDTKNQHQKKVSFEDNATSVRSQFDVSDRDKTTSDPCEVSDPDDDDDDSRPNDMGGSLEMNSKVTTCYSCNSDFDYILGLASKNGSYRESRESLKYIKEHKCELVGILKYLLMLAGQNPSVFQRNDNAETADLPEAKPCVGIQCKLSQEDPRKGALYATNSKNLCVAEKRQHLLKSRSETGPSKVESESESVGSDSFKLLSSQSDSGVYSTSSVSSRRRQFVSLPDVLEGAPVASGEEAADESASKRVSEDSMESKESSSLLASCFSTSVSCQASQTPDVDDFSQVSTSDGSETQYKVLETQSSTTLQQEKREGRCSEDTESREETTRICPESTRICPENSRSCPEIKETNKATRSRIVKILRKIGRGNEK